MTRREQILLGVMGAVAVVGALSFAMPGGGGVTPKAVQTTPASTVVQNVQKALAEVPVSPSQLYVLDAAVRQASGNPFRLPPAPTVRSGSMAGPGGTDSAQTMAYTGYLAVGNMVFAIVDGLEYRTGEAVADSGYVVKSITPGKVVLAAAEDGTERELPYTGDDL
ncbi:hypothetical protein [Nitratidesulfovibrio vulgaris]|jgi:hypothetical protein|uniref:Type IV pilus biogenesis protein PilP n=1 Tax=Nitratidesulfovibrio vulgaris (strain DP4) TaxID=391774 RepID=A0A0H3AAY3_NITV4|nr:hypothetical protein [Nitratidesulfovibrio vulgaris]ABM28807.1 conserved hypothetical protein [Nitratidesulfovibrio vulgaris DP4]ADP86335.1 hypothetical protein Deval_1174 [Nitratidesulfovibrio vulgaris RCH1]GEB79023.1 hypothetical protein DDE01_04380 [Desulfovibrio desulfuricans]HBW15710.1 hypothetical protein [Desulfovibrio sp.]